MIHHNESFWWLIQKTHQIHSSKWFINMILMSDESFWWVNLMILLVESFWWVILMSPFDESIWWVVWCGLFLNPKSQNLNTNTQTKQGACRWGCRAPSGHFSESCWCRWGGASSPWQRSVWHVCDVTDLCVWHDWFMCVTWLFILSTV